MVEQHADHRRHHHRPVVTRCCSIASTSPRRARTAARTPRRRQSPGSPSTPPIDAAWNIGVWCRYTSVARRTATARRDVVQVQHLGALVEQHALRQAGGAAGVHEDDRVVLLGLVGDGRRRRARADPRSGRRAARRRRRSARRARAAIRSHCGDVVDRRAAKHASTKHTSVPESARMNCELASPRAAG